MRPLRTLAVAWTLLAAAPLAAQTPQAGWTADLATHFHGVAGLVTVVDEDTLRVEDFYYDGTGIDVYFYLGAENTAGAFNSGLSVGPQLLGPPFNGAELLFDLPVGETIDGWNAISVWCVTVGVSFGDAVFQPPAAVTGDYNGDGLVDAADYTVWRDTQNDTGEGLAADADGNGVVDGLDYAAWAAAYGGAGATAVPEPAAWMLVAGLAAAGVIRPGRGRARP